jgi:hypothetical protein
MFCFLGKSRFEKSYSKLPFPPRRQTVLKVPYDAGKDFR